MSESPYIVLGAVAPPVVARALAASISPAMVERALDDAGIYGEAHTMTVDFWRSLSRVGRVAVSKEPEISTVKPEAAVLSAEEAGIRLGLTGKRVRQLAQQGAIPGEQTVSGRWRFEAAAVAAFAAERTRL